MIDVETYRHYLVEERRFTPGIFEFLKKQYAAANKRMYQNAEFMVAHENDADTGTKAWVAWMAESCEPCGIYFNVLEMLRDERLVTFTDEEISTCWGLYTPQRVKKAAEGAANG